MRLFELVNTTTFRVTLIYMIMFGGFSAFVVFFFYYTSVTFMARQTDQTIEAEVLGLAEANRSMGRTDGLRTMVDRRSTEPGDSLYLLATEERTWLAGNLLQWPDSQPSTDGWTDFIYDRKTVEGTEARPARARVFQLTSGEYLLVGRDVSRRRSIENALTTWLYMAIIFLILVGGAGGMVISSLMMRRIDTINRTSRDIIAGDLSRRVPVQGQGDEVDQIANNLNAMLDQIERLMTGMREVTDNVAHDLRSPLTRLRNRLEVTMMKPTSKGEYNEALEGAIRDADHLLSTFNALLSIAQVEAGSSRESMDRVNTRDVVQDIAELYEPVAESKNIAFSVDPGDDAVVWGNRELLSQALANLVDNAIKYTPDGGKVTVELRTRQYGNPLADVVVMDSGPGIPAKDRARVLNRFVRLEASRNTPGSGLGLSLVSAVARLHEGRLVLGDSDHTGKGQKACGLKTTLSLPMVR